MPVSRRNGLLVVEEATDFRAVDAALADIDRRLFIAYEIEAGRPVYRVMVDQGDHGAAVLCDWRDEHGQPLPLSSGLVEQVKSQRPREGPDLGRSERANAELKARQLADFDEAVDGIAEDVGARMSGRRSAVLPRGIGLRRARSRTGHHERQDLK